MHAKLAEMDLSGWTYGCSRRQRQAAVSVERDARFAINEISGLCDDCTLLSLTGGWMVPQFAAANEKTSAIEGLLAHSCSVEPAQRVEIDETGRHVQV